MNYYGLENRSTIGKLVGVYDGERNIEDILDGAIAYTSATVRGYCSQNKKAIFEYNGKYGKGFVVCYPSINPYNGKPSTNYMDIVYYILPKQEEK